MLIDLKGWFKVFIGRFGQYSQRLAGPFRTPQADKNKEESSAESKMGAEKTGRKESLSRARGAGRRR